MEQEPRHQYGGQAIIEGVMIRGRDQAAVAVRNPAGEICVRELNVPGWATGQFRTIPYLRGMVIFAETLIVGMRALSMSAALSLEDDDEEGAEESISNFTIGLMLIVAIGLGIGIFFLAPFFVSKIFENSFGSIGANIIEGGLRLAAFVGYVWLISKMNDIERVLGYHGAEHMAVHAQEAGHEMTVDSVKKFPPAHPRCGTAFLLTVMLLAILVFIFIPREPISVVILSRVLLVPLIAAAAYEFIRYAGRHPDNIGMRVLIGPSLLLQQMTTRPPNDDQIEVAIEALNHAVRLDQDASTEDHNVPPTQIWVDISKEMSPEKVPGEG
jgi:uncharacterized protein YqhQ